MIILPDRQTPRSKLLLPMPRSSWAKSQRACTYGIDNRVRFRLTARLADGHIAWRGFFDDRDDADAFLAALAKHLACGQRMPQEIVRLVSETPIGGGWSRALTEQLATYEFETLHFLTANPGTQQEWKVPADWIAPGAPGLWDELLAWSGSPAYFTSGTSDTAPTNWNSGNNAIEAIGGGGGGRTSTAGSPFAGGGGGGGEYRKAANVTLTPGGSVSYSIGSGGAGNNAGTDTTFNSTTVVAKAGAAGGSATGGAGGSGGTGSAANANGGTGGNQQPTNNGAGGGGGGAGGPNGAGGSGGTAAAGLVGGGGGGGNGGGSNGGNPNTGTGGTGGNNSGGSGGGAGGTGAVGSAGTNGGGGGGGGGSGSTSYAGGAGSTGTEWTTHGSGGGGGGGGNGTSSPAGGNGGTYGGGGGAGGYSIGTGGTGGQGLIVITYTPFVGGFNMPMLGM